MFIFAAFSSWRRRFKAASGQFPEQVKRNYPCQQRLHTIFPIVTLLL